MKEERFKALVAIHILFMKENEVLMLRRKNISLDGLYSLVAGHLDGGERAIDAAIREAKEEVGVDIGPDDIDMSTVCHCYSRLNDKEFVQFFAICRTWKGEIINNEPDKCADLKFFPIDQLPKNTVPYIRSGIEKTTQGVKYYEYGWVEGED